MPASVAFGEKSAAKAHWPLPGQTITGELSGKDVPLDEAEQRLTTIKGEYWVSIKGKRSYFSEKEEKPTTEGCPYDEKFVEGATIFPRSAWFVTIENASRLGMDPAKPAGYVMLM